MNSNQGGQTGGNGGTISPNMRSNVGSLITYIIDTVITSAGVSMADPKVSSAIGALKLTASMLFQELVKEEAREMNRG